MIISRLNSLGKDLRLGNLAQWRIKAFMGVEKQLIIRSISTKKKNCMKMKKRPKRPLLHPNFLAHSHATTYNFSATFLEVYFSDRPFASVHCCLQYHTNVVHPLHLISGSKINNKTLLHIHKHNSDYFL